MPPPDKIPAAVANTLETIPLKKLSLSFRDGMVVMVVGAPFVNACNTLSIAQNFYPIRRMVPTIRFVYAGHYLGAGGSNIKPYSSLNFLAGIEAHFFKESVRGLYKGAALGVLNPTLQQLLPPTQADLAFAFVMSGFEILINPADSLRVWWQANEKPKWTFRALYAGAGLNGIRQFGTWWCFSASTRVLDQGLRSSGIDPNTVWALAIKAYPQSLFITSMVYIFEVLKNRIQREQAKGFSLSFMDVYKGARKAVSQEGVSSLLRGIGPKYTGNAVLAFGAALVQKMACDREAEEKRISAP